MPHVVRYRCAALDLADGWVDMGPIPLRKELRHETRPGEFSISVSPLQKGLKIDFPTLVAQQREWERLWEEAVHAGRLSVLLGPRRMLPGSSWEGPHTFGISWQSSVGPSALRRRWSAGRETRWICHWRVSDGRSELRAMLVVSLEHAFTDSVADCDAMMRSVRFEGPS